MTGNIERSSQLPITVGIKSTSLSMLIEPSINGVMLKCSILFIQPASMYAGLQSTNAVYRPSVYCILIASYFLYLCRNSVDWADDQLSFIIKEYILYQTWVNTTF